MPKWSPNQPYNELPPLPPKAEIETKKILKLCIKARAALAEIKEGCNLLPNPSILINIIPLLEAQASSKIENVVTTTDNLFLYAENQESADPKTKEALRYRTALYEGSQYLIDRPLCTNTAIEVCRIIKGVHLDIRTTPGTKLINDSSNEVIYTPPEGEKLLREKLLNLEHFIHEKTDLDPLIKMAVMHYQFEAIHPFIDGNGRTGRILNLLYLIQEDLLKIPILYLSGYIIQHKYEYYSLLLEVTASQSWENWICFILHAIEETANWTMRQVKAIRELMEKASNVVRFDRPKIHSKELIESIFVQPYCRISHLENSGLGHRQTISSNLKQLCELGILKEIKFGREKVFINIELMELLNSPNKI